MPSRTAQTITLLRKIYGLDRPKFIGSPHEGDPLDDAEIILHELAHQTLLPAKFIFTPGAMEKSFDQIGDYIDTIPVYQRDLHEIRALAIELLVAKQLQLPLDKRAILRNGTRNCELYKGCQPREFSRVVLMAQRTAKVRFHADTILCLLEESRNEARKPKQLH